MRLGRGLCLAAFAGMLSVAPASAQIDLPSMHADPSKYMLYRCPQLAQARPALVKRMQDLERLTAKAATSPGGAIVGRMTYRSEYLAMQGDLQNLDRRAAELNCPPAPATPPATRDMQNQDRPLHRDRRPR
ncbi:MAG TPA: twin-arginine translocation pathway signal [Pseudolabrys sp.]|nr:twin-arginine translocation pathway signal [Pseudolabrys sp.]